MTQTGNYELNQWAETDRIQMEDFNSDNEKIDAALKANADAVAAVLAAAGNCQMEMLTYTGTGTYSTGKPTTITFSQKPDIYIVCGDGSIIIGRNDSAGSIIITKSGSSVVIASAGVSWSGNKLSISNDVSAKYQMNTTSAPYWAAGLKIK